MLESKSSALPTWRRPNIYGAPERSRTPDTRIRSPLLYPTELQVHFFTGAGEGNRTLATGLEGQGSTTELHPHMVEGTGFEPVKAQLTDLQSVPFGQLGNPSIFGAGERT